MTECPTLSDPTPLHNYLDRIGNLFKLPGSELVPLPPPPTPKPPAQTRKWFIGAAVVVVLAGFVIAVTEGEASERLPAKLLGAWGTTDRRYVDRRFWIAEKEIAFQIGPTVKQVAIYSLRAVRQRPGGGDTTFIDLDYGAAEAVATLSIALLERPSLTILFRSQAGLRWTPAIGGTWPSGLSRPSQALDFGR